ncbi:MAG: TolC family protein [Candidatus Zixiibacteriota bacterium]
MRPLKTILLVITGFCSITSFSRAQTITQEEFLNQLKQMHPVFEKEKLKAQIEKEGQKSLLGTQDWNIISSATFAHQEPAIAIAGPERTDAFMISGGVEKLFWRSGGRLSASFSSSRANLKIDPFYGFPDSYYENQFSIAYVHPLLKNRIGFLDRLQYELKQYDIDFSDVQALENQEDFLANSAAKFLDWVLLTEQKTIASDRLSLAEEELARTKKKRQAHLVDQIDVIRAEDAVSIGKQNQMLVESQGKSLQAELAVLSQNEELRNLSPQFDLHEVEQLIPLEDAISEVKTKSRIIRAINIRLRQLELVRRGFDETAKPNLSLLAQLNTKNLDESFGKSLAMDKPDALVGLQFSVPLENRTAKYQVTKTDLQISQLQKQVDEVTLELSSALTHLHIQITELEEVLKLNEEQIESARQKTEEELKLYNQGRGDLTFVIQSRDNEEKAKLTYAQNSIFYHKLILQYRALMDELLPSNNKMQE